MDQDDHVEDMEHMAHMEPFDPIALPQSAVRLRSATPITNNCNNPIYKIIVSFAK